MTVAHVYRITFKQRNCTVNIKQDKTTPCTIHRSTQPGHPFVGRRNEYQPKGSDALQLGSKGRYGSCVGGR